MSVPVWSSRRFPLAVAFAVAEAQRPATGLPPEWVRLTLGFVEGATSLVSRGRTVDARRLALRAVDTAANQ